MESTGPEPPHSRPVERISLTDEQKKSLQETIDQAREEELARRQSMPTKLLGWMLIGGFCLEIAGCFTDNHNNLGGLLFCFAGFGILRGSQAWLRFATFFVVPGSVGSLADLVGSVVFDYPVEVGNHWVDFRQLSFWTLGVSPAMLMFAESFLAVLAFKFRRVRFWTRTVAVFAGLFAIVLLLGTWSHTKDWHRNRSTGREIPAEIQAARSLMTAYGAGSSRPFINNAVAVFDPMERVQTVEWQSSSSATTQVYDRGSRGGRPSSSSRIRRYSEWLRLPSGEWGKLELEVILPKKP